MAAAPLAALAAFQKTTVLSNYKRVYYENKTWKGCTIGLRNAFCT